MVQTINENKQKKSSKSLNPFNHGSDIMVQASRFRQFGNCGNLTHL